MTRRGDQEAQDDPAESPPAIPDPGDLGPDRRLRDGGAVRSGVLAIEWAAQGPPPASLGAVSLARPGDEWADPPAPAPDDAPADRRAGADARIARSRHADLGRVGLAVRRYLLDRPRLSPHPVTPARVPLRRCDALRAGPGRGGTGVPPVRTPGARRASRRDLDSLCGDRTPGELADRLGVPHHRGSAPAVRQRESSASRRPAH